jgi:acyl carrier protein
MRIDDVLDHLQLLSAAYEGGVYGVYEWKKISKKVSGSTASYTILDAQTHIAKILGGTADRYPENTVLKNVGLDSLSIMEVVHHLNSVIGATKFKASYVTDVFKIQDMVSFVAEHGVISSISPAPIVSAQDATESPNGTTSKPTNDEAIATLAPVVAVVNFIEVSIPPNSINFNAILDALRTSRVVVLRQDDKDVFNLGSLPRT